MHPQHTRRRKSRNPSALQEFGRTKGKLPNQNSGPVMAVRPAVVSPDPNSRAPELKCSTHRRTLCSIFSASKHLWIQAAVTVPDGNIQFGGLVRPWFIIVTHSQIYILGKSLARLNLPMLLMRGMMTTFKLTNILGEPNDYIFEKFVKADVKN